MKKQDTSGILQTPRGKSPRKGESHGYLPPVRSGALGLLHTALERALPLKTSEIAKPAIEALGEGLWDHGDDVVGFRAHYLRASVLKRWQGGSSDDVDARETVALQSLLDSEVRNRFTNHVFHDDTLDWSNAQIPLHLLKVYRRARRILSTILGRFDWEKFPRCVDFTPGATSELPRKRSSVQNKWEMGTHVTPRARPYAEAYRKWSKPPRLDWGPGLGRSNLPEFQEVWANCVFTVPKNFTTRRTACKPATYNGALQKGVGTMIRHCLQRSEAKLLLPDAQYYHGILAKLGSATGHLVTGDLANASNSVTTGHCKVFFPPDWAAVMLDLREEIGLLPDGSLVSWEMLGTMGNGFTFEAETALFYSIVKACCSKGSLVSVYGDDLIYPEKYHDLVVEAMEYAGFSFNREKTFSGNSPFRESCGAYYYRGVDVKPFFVEQLPTRVDQIIDLHNQVLLYFRGSPPEEWAKVLAAARKCVPRQFWGPHGYQGCLWSEWDRCRPKYKPRHQAFEVWRCTLADLPQEFEGYYGRYLAQLWKGKAQRDAKQPLPQNESPLWNVLTGEPGWTDALPAPEWRSTANSVAKASKASVDRTQWTGRLETDVFGLVT